MEKFSTWRDKGTGISPFMPNEFPLQQQIQFQKQQRSKISYIQTQIKIFGLYILKSILFSIKFPIFIISSLIYYLFPIKVVLKFILLVLFSFNNVNVSVDGVKRTKTDQILQNQPNLGDIIIINYISPLDGLIIHLISNVYHWKVIKLYIPDSIGRLHQYSIWEFINFSFNSKQKGKLIDEKDLSKLDLSTSINFFLLEGTASNNKAILPFIITPQIVNLLNQTSQPIKSIIVKFQPNYYTLPIPNLYSKVYYLFEILSNLSSSNFIKVKIYNINNERKDVINKVKQSFQENNLSIISDNLDIDEKSKFIHYYLNYDLIESKKKK
ncbi:putative vacuolar sorting protein [Scheffersomyces coipomensis]|uniref:putative vacuolar sorting protein n=1 Tax=Scheffersomyces coipomensis TaxID=1788519 RepID=UPI00315DD1E5